MIDFGRKTKENCESGFFIKSPYTLLPQCRMSARSHIFEVLLVVVANHLYFPVERLNLSIVSENKKKSQEFLRRLIVIKPDVSIRIIAINPILGRLFD